MRLQPAKRRLWRLSLCVIAMSGPVSFLAHLSTPSSSSRAAGQEAVGDLEKSASWKWPDLVMLEQHLVSYLDQKQATDADRRKVLDYWKASADQNQGPQVLDRILNTAAIVEPRIDDVVKQLNDPAGEPVIPSKLTWLTSDAPGWLQDAVRLAAGRALAQRRLYDEAMEAMSGLDAATVCDPSSLIFYRAVCEHHLLQKKECVADIALLLEREKELPVRYTQVAHLMSADINPLKDDSLDEVARLMTDVQRRLDLGRAGKRVRDEEDQIVAKLDKLIEQIEQQMQQQQQQQQQNSDSQQQPQGGSAKPMEDSQIAGGSGPGDVDPKKLSNNSAWGNLPPAERQAALQRLTEELPSHYRDVIEGYFRQLAKEKK
ncbi:MAG: hypothetical protein U0892_02205 [Pirellulales bacterium]